MGRSRKRILQQIYARILLMLESLDKNGVLIYSNYNEGKSVIAERCIKKLKGKKYIKEWQLMIANVISVIWTN